MFKEVKSMLPVSGNGYDAEIILQINAAALDLTKTAEIVLPGEIKIVRADDGTVTDTSTVTDALIITAIATWCSMRLGNPANYDNLLKAYEAIKGALRISGSYTDFEPESDET